MHSTSLLQHEYKIIYAVLIEVAIDYYGLPALPSPLNSLCEVLVSRLLHIEIELRELDQFVPVHEKELYGYFHKMSAHSLNN